MAAPRDDGDEEAIDGERWRFDLDDVDEEGIIKPGIEPGDPNPENVLFVLLGALAMVLVIVRIFLLVA